MSFCRAVVALSGVVGLFAGAAANAQALPDCGDDPAEPYFKGIVHERDCATAVGSYFPRYQGAAYEALALDDVVCGVPEASVKLLDEIVEEARNRITALGLDQGALTRESALRISEAVGEILVERGFQLRIPTRTMTDGLWTRSGSIDPNGLHIVDCDISTLILLTVAQQFHLPAKMVDSRLALGAGHNYIEWALGPTKIYWDTNARSECSPLPDQPAWLGYGMSPEEVRAYLLNIRSGSWRRVGLARNGLADLQEAMKLAPHRPDPFNNFAWLVSTTVVEDREALKAPALAASQHAVELDRSAGYLDTLACAYALNGDMIRARAVMEEAIARASAEQVADFRRRLALFGGLAPTDCTGQ